MGKVRKPVLNRLLDDLLDLYEDERIDSRELEHISKVRSLIHEIIDSE
jgi:hypothetical protein